MDYERVSDRDWEEMVLKSDNAYFFSSPAWAKILEKTYNYRTATRLYHLNGKSILIPMMEKNTKFGFKSFSSMPFGYGGIYSQSVITNDESTKIVKDIIGGRCLSFNLSLPPYLDISTNYKLALEIKDEWNYTHILDIKGQDFEEIWKNYEKRTRGHIRKAIKLGVEVRDAASLDDFKTFYEIWSKSSQKWGYDTPPHPFKFFQNLFEYGSPYVRLTLATEDEQIIAGLISFRFNKTILLWTSAFLPEYGKYNPTRLLDNEAIKQACQEDYEYLNFGGSGKLREIKRYKEGFGAVKVEIKRYKILSNVGKMLVFLNR